MAVVLITGCSSGIGRVSALHFARQGDTVFASMRDLAKAGPIEQTRAAEGLAIKTVQLDVTDATSVANAVKQVIETAGRIDMLVNNAGIAARGPLEETDDRELMEVFQTNFFGALRVARAGAPAMRERRSGTIVNVSSMAAVVTSPFRGAYSASKRALEAASEALSWELHPFGVSVVLVEPGGFETQMEASERVPRRFTEGSPYFELERKFAGALARLPAASARGDPQAVAETIYQAAHDEQPKLRYLVGLDAEAVAAMRRQLDDEAFEQAVRQALDFWD
jgi:NAD(P)-dependent dehydrogenase (short-subunit alcohol dehydrogenase family)